MDENKLMLLFLSKKLGTNDPKKILKYLKGLDKQKLLALAQEYQLWKESLKTQQAQKAAHGAKLQYIKSLKHICPEGEELVYFKQGGSVKCGCKKKEQGGEVPTAKCGAAAKFKKVKKGLDGPKNTLKFKDLAARDSFYINTYGAEDLESTRPGKNIPNKNYNPNDPNSKTHIWVPDRTKPPYNKLKKEKREEPMEPKVTKPKSVSKSSKSTTKKDVVKTLLQRQGSKISKTVDKFKSAKCGSKLKKHLLGGSLNRIPFMLTGTPKGGITRSTVMLGNSGTADNPYAYTSRDLINTATGIITGDYDHGTRPVSDVEVLLVNGLGVPPKPTKKFFDTGYKVGLTIKGIVSPPTPAVRNPMLNTETFIDLLRRAARKLNSIDINKAGLILGRYADATGSQGGFRKSYEKK